jgi:arylamine N-acetyltransferase
LRALGYHVRPVLARVRWNKRPDESTTFTHLALLVRLPSSSSSSGDAEVQGGGDEYLIDVGFGGIGPMAPLLASSEPSQMADGRYRVVDAPVVVGGDHAANYRALQFELNGVWTDLYWFRYGSSSLV